MMNFAELSKMVAESNDIDFLKDMGEKLKVAIKEKIKQNKTEARRTGRPRGRPFVFDDKMQIVKALTQFTDESAEKKPSQRHVMQLAEKGYLEPYASLAGAKGRPIKAYRLSKMGKKILTIANRSAKKAEETNADHETA